MVGILFFFKFLCTFIAYQCADAKCWQNLKKFEFEQNLNLKKNFVTQTLGKLSFLILEIYNSKNECRPISDMIPLKLQKWC
jgi:hypothetical protein